jgi:hypothetical protein
MHGGSPQPSRPRHRWPLRYRLPFRQRLAHRRVDGARTRVLVRLQQRRHPLVEQRTVLRRKALAAAGSNDRSSSDSRSVMTAPPARSHPRATSRAGDRPAATGCLGDHGQGHTQGRAKARGEAAQEDSGCLDLSHRMDETPRHRGVPQRCLRSRQRCRGAACSGGSQVSGVGGWSDRDPAPRQPVI